jgi:hypothetical protein
MIKKKIVIQNIKQFLKLNTKKTAWFKNKQKTWTHSSPQKVGIQMANMPQQYEKMLSTISH